MMYINRTMKAVGLSLILLGCDWEGTLLDLYPYEPIVNAETGVFIRENELLVARLHNRKNVVGVTRKGWFTTTDYFHSFEFEDGLWPGEQGVWDASHGLMVHAVPEAKSWRLRFSADDGRTWGNGHGLSEDLSLVRVAVGADKTAWFLGTEVSDGGARLVLYRSEWINQPLLWFAAVGAVPLGLGFFDSDSGWMLYRKPTDANGSVRIARSLTGGRTWTDQSVISGLTDPALTVLGAQRLLVYGRTGPAYLSTDAGGSFEKVIIANGRVIHCLPAGAQVVYALLDEGIAKSVDGGKTWRQLPAWSHGINVSGKGMSFYNEQRGIVYGPDRLFFTVDGGESWEIGIYPYAYVME